MIVEQYAVRCVGPPDEDGRRHCLGCRKEAPCSRPGCGMGMVTLYGGPPDKPRRGARKSEKNRHGKRQRMEERDCDPAVGP